MFSTNITRLSISLLAMFVLSGCSTLGVYDYLERPQARNLPPIPEIKPQAVVRAVPPKYTPPAKAQVRKYSNTPNPQVITKEEQVAARELFKEQAKQSATVDIDPYATVPENSSATSVANAGSSSATVSSSPAVKSLMVSARADITIGKTQSAVSKLERGLRIESRNPQLWHLLAKAHYAQSDYQQTISMARKSIQNTNNQGLISQNWQLIKQAGERSGDATAIKDALDYYKLNP